MKTLRQVVGEGTHFGKRTEKSRAQETVRRQKRVEKCPDCGKVHTGSCSTMSEGQSWRSAHKFARRHENMKAHLTRLMDKHSDHPEAHFDARSVHQETTPGDYSLGTVRKHLDHMVVKGEATKHESGAGRAKFVGYRLKQRRKRMDED